MTIKKKILIATGGTGGHVFPAYALAKHFKKKKLEVQIVLDKRGLCFLKNYQDIKFKIITSSPIFKKKPLNILISTSKNIFAFFNSIFILLKFKPNIVIGMGGYSSFPVCIASRMLRIKFITYENNLYIGKTNKYLLPFASKMLVAYSELKGIDNNHIEKIFRIGNILREEILNFNTNVKLNKDTFNVLVLGGSQAAKSLGEKLPKIFENFSKEKIKITIYQQCLVEQKEMLEKFYKNLGFKCEIFNFSNNLSDYFTKTDLVITRSGSSMIAELINCNLPFIAIPLPTSAENHQLINAKYFEEKGYGFCVEEKEIDTRLFQLIKSIHEDRDLLDVIKKKQKNCSDKLVFEKIDKQLDEIINE